MFIDAPAHWPDDPKPEPPKRRLSPRGEKLLLVLLGFNMILLVVAPIGGVSLLHWLVAVLGR
ncbi:conserved hypothetical protein [Bradyrhizobium oligotrophicum S58]|uniref:Uncharacterized protein n=1 Tax=Bradyrhizobium oligotrophicum S58 TaxID=1245469 RepID=M4Z1H6_9BRAD|nr:hypothetical protein [Bradyrhizobium oligotrophicum]BAM86988.1 conserved hypothetical protein [Bradyrhizobium oligotrophicum S58]